MSSQRRAITFALVVAVGLVAIGSRRIARRHEQVRLGYELAQARRQLAAADDENRRLRVEHEVLISPERLRPLAVALGMRHAGPGQLRPVHRDSPQNSEPLTLSRSAQSAVQESKGADSGTAP